jgi:probable HAF family extracellular repeat protein
MASPHRREILRSLRLPVAVVAALAVGSAAALAQDQVGLFAGFLLDRGRYTAIEAPSNRVRILPLGINDRGQIVGEYIIDNRRESGFVRDGRGRITRFDVPGARSTAPEKINNSGQIVGSYSVTAAFVKDPDARPRSFLLDRGRLTKIHVPGAVLTLAHGVNDRGQVVGVYVDAGSRGRGFLWQRGRFTTIDVPGSGATEPIDINNRGEITGAYTDRDDPTGATGAHGFVLSRGGYTKLDAPGALFTQPFGINDRGQIVGVTSGDLTGRTARGFLLSKVKGPFAFIDFPGAALTVAFDNNNRGQIVGTYANPTATPSAGERGAEPPSAMPRLLPDLLEAGRRPTQ